MKYIKGIKKAIIDRLTELEGTTIDKDKILDETIMNTIADITEILGKEVAVFIDRRGEVLECAIGDENTVAAISKSYRRGESSLSGVRCIHTHPNGNPNLSDVDAATLIKLKYDMMVAVAVKAGKPDKICLGWLGMDGERYIAKVTKSYSPADILKVDLQGIIRETEEELRGQQNITIENINEIERAVLVGQEDEKDLDELAELLKTSGGEEVGRLVQNRNKIDKAYFIGTGKLKELSLLAQTVDANLIIFDEELSGMQVKNIEEALGLKVIDRTQLILDIFAQRARTKEGKLQVELAQLKYIMPRLIGMGGAMSRTGAGIGARGPGEKKLELDRRRIRDKVYDLENELKELNKRRSTLRNNRNENNNFQVCIVGYTNAGKSTLLNTLANADIYAQDQLFATLDPTTRKVSLNSGREVLVTDTVGFIRKLPHDLIEAFKSTLEEVVYADLLLHVVDCSNPEWKKQYDTVHEVLEEISGNQKNMVVVINKTDKAAEDLVDELCKSLEKETIRISAKKNIGMESLLDAIERYSSMGESVLEVKIPYAEGALQAFAHNHGKVIEERYEEDGIYMKFEMNAIYESKFQLYKVL